MNDTGRPISARDERSLNAYHDDELNPLSRWLFGRRLARSAALRAQFEEIRAVSDLVQRAESSAPSVDLWDKIALSLPAVDAQRSETVSEVARPAWFGRPLFAVAATVAVAVALVLGTIGDTPVPDSGVVRWLDAGGRSVIVLDESDDATIVWLLESPTEGAARGGTGESV